MKYAPGKHPNAQKNLRPPWVKGQSGNPKGRPKGSATKRKLLTLIDQDLKEEAQKILRRVNSDTSPQN